MTKIDTTCEHTKIRLIAAALGHQQCTRTAASLIPLLGTDHVIAIGTVAEVARLLETAPPQAAPTAQEVTQQAAKAETAEQDAREMEIAQAVRRACVECYSPDDLADDWSEKMGDLNLSSIIKSVAPTTSTVSAPEEVRHQWISVDERLPELYQTVALLDEKRWMNTGSSDHNVNWHGSGYLCEFGGKFWSIFGEMRSQCLDAVTHWMPLPEAPSTTSGKGEAA